MKHNFSRFFLNRVNIDEELAKVDQKAKEDAPKKQSKAKPAMSDRVNTTGEYVISIVKSRNCLL